MVKSLIIKLLKQLVQFTPINLNTQENLYLTGVIILEFTNP